jgi:hypothetical protein
MSSDVGGIASDATDEHPEVDTAEWFELVGTGQGVEGDDPLSRLVAIAATFP